MDRRAERALLSDNTAPELEQLQVSRWREMSSTEKARLITALCQAADTLALAGIRQRFPTHPQESVFSGSRCSSSVVSSRVSRVSRRRSVAELMTPGREIP